MERDSSGSLRSSIRGRAIAILAALVFGGTLIDARVSPALCGDRVVEPEAGEECEGPGICFAGTSHGSSCEENRDCPEGQCLGDRFGGDGCAANCTEEARFRFVFDPSESGGFIRTDLGVVDFDLGGEVELVVGGGGVDGLRPVVIPARGVQLDPVPVPGISCACVRALEDPSLGPGNAARGTLNCGAGTLSTDVVMRQNHRLGVLGRCGGEEDGGVCTSLADCPDSFCLDDALCVARGGEVEGEVASCDAGTCRGGRLEGFPCGASEDCPSDPHPGVCRGGSEMLLSGAEGRGAAFVRMNVSLTLIEDGGTCSVDPGDPAKGADGIPCNEDDPELGRARIVPVTTGRSTGELLSPGNRPESPAFIASFVGEALDCDELGREDTRVTGGEIVTVFPLLDVPGPFGTTIDTVATAFFRASVLERPTATAAPSTTPSPSPTATALPCPFDCDADGDFGPRDLRIALDRRAARCPAFDLDDDARVDVAELLRSLALAAAACF